MALTTLVAGNTITAAGLNDNFSFCVLTDTAKTISVTHTYSASQTFSAGWTAAAACTITAASATALTVGRQGATDPVLLVHSSTASQATGIKVTGAAAAGGVAVAAISSGTNENLTIEAKGSGTITIGGTSTGNVLLAGGGGSVRIGVSPSAIIHTYTTGSTVQARFERFGGTAGTRGKVQVLHTNFGYAGGTGSETVFSADWGLELRVNAQSSAVTALLLTNGQSVVCGSAAIATTATDGFLYIPSCAGTPTGTPTTFTGRIPLIYDSTNDFLYVYRSGWKKSTVYT